MFLSVLESCKDNQVTHQPGSMLYFTFAWVDFDYVPLQARVGYRVGHMQNMSISYFTKVDIDLGLGPSGS